MQSTKGKVEAQSGALKTATLNVQYGTIRAPISGLIGDTLDPLRPNGPVRPNVKFFRRANDAGLNDFNSTAQSAAGAALIAHLGGELFLGGEAAHFAGFPDGLGERLLAIDMFAHLEGRHGGQTVHMIWRGDRHRVNRFAHLLEHLAPIAISLGVVGAALFGGAVLELGIFLVECVRIDIAQGDDVAAESKHAGRIAVPFSADANAGDVDALVGPLPAQEVRSAHHRRAGEKRSGFEEVTTVSVIESLLLHGSFVPDLGKSTSRFSQRNLRFFLGSAV